MATVTNSSKYHIVSLSNQPKLKERPELWDGHPFCEGQFNYYWKLKSKIERIHPDVCAKCLRKWKSIGSPEVVGMVENNVVPVGDISLPLAWREVTPCGNEEDLEVEKDRPLYKEIRRWQRGLRVVRILEASFTDPEQREHNCAFKVESGWFGKETKDARVTSDFKEALKDCRERMLLGGSRKN